MLGASYFVGIIVATALCPVGYLSDLYGRKWIFVMSITLAIIACIGLLLASQLVHLYLSMFLLGLTHPGRVIVALAYADEFLHLDQRSYLVPVNQIVNGLIIIMTAFYFQMIARDIKYIQIVNILVLAIMTIYVSSFVPESPKWLAS